MLLPVFADVNDKWACAVLEKAFPDREIVPITVNGENGEEVVSRDEGIRPDSNIEKLATLKTNGDQRELQTWSAFARALLSVNEFVFVD